MEPAQYAALLSGFTSEIEKIAYDSAEYDDNYMLGSVLSRMAGQAQDLRGRIRSGVTLPSWAEYKVYKAYDSLLSALGSTYDSPAMSKKASVVYRGTTFPGYNKPIASNRAGKKKMVLVKRGDKVKLVHFGQKGYEDYTQHGSEARRKNYLTRSAGIRDKSGNLTKNDPFSPNYWARKELW